MLLVHLLEYSHTKMTRKSVERVLLDVLDLKQVEIICSYSSVVTQLLGCLRIHDNAITSVGNTFWDLISSGRRSRRLGFWDSCRSVDSCSGSYTRPSFCMNVRGDSSTVHPGIESVITQSAYIIRPTMTSL